MAVQYYAEPDILFQVSRGSFLPPPNVDSSVIRLQLRQEPPVSLWDEKLFFRLVKAAFGQRRKTVLNSAAAGLSLEKSRLEAACHEAGIVPSARAEQLSLEEFAALSNALAEERG